ncbi:MAG: hypothetical protein ACREE9_09360 [Stellaceae bacterium]
MLLGGTMRGWAAMPFIASWNARANCFSVYGLAQPEAGGWRFRDNMNAADPEQRCEALIARLPDGGYSFAVTQAGGCVADGSYGASPQPGQKILFPAGSRQGAVPPGKPMAEAMSLERGAVTFNTPQPIALMGKSSAVAASAGERWTTYSIAAFSITGDVTFAPDRITKGSNGGSLFKPGAGLDPRFRVREEIKTG